MAAAAGAASISLEGVGKTFAGTVRAVDGIDLAIAAGEFFALLGPSGCGKTTTLRMIAGFEMPDRGRILVAGRDITRLPVHRRDMGMIFQSYALFPHRTVWENVAFGLRMRRLPRSEIAARVRDALRQVALAGLEDRRPGQLSGGQQQRVALARALVIRPSVLLCDEPLGALDRKLRQQMQFELKRLQKELGVTLVFVTHDQEEALAMSDRIAVMNAGRVEQVGTPGAVYATPRTRFVAGFIGETNIFAGRFDGVRFVADDGRPLPAPPATARTGAAAIAIRPEKMRIVADREGILPGRIETANYLGDATLYRISGEGGRIMLAKETNLGRQAAHAPGEAVALAWGAEDAVVLED